MLINLLESELWEPGIYQLETTDPVLGGNSGVSNIQANQLANRTAYLKQAAEAAQSTADTAVANAAAAQAAANAAQATANAAQDAADAAQTAADAALANAATAQTTANIAAPPGAVMAFARNTPPAGWLECNGATISRTTYAALFASIGTTFGVGDGTNTFVLPDLRGEFTRGWDNGRGIDASRQFGSNQAASGVRDVVGIDSSGIKVGVLNGDAVVSAGTTTSVPTSTQQVTGTIPMVQTLVRPRNIALLYCIKI
jgi:microcystin-dependent protein